MTRFTKLMLLAAFVVALAAFVAGGPYGPF